MAESSLIIKLGAEVSQALKGLRSVYSGLDRLVVKATSLNAINFGGLIGLATAGLGVGGLAVKIAGLGANAETTRLTFQTMLGSIERGDAMMARLDRFSNSTPYSGDQVNRAAKTLMAFGVKAGNVEETLRAIGDVAAGSGKDFNALSALSAIYGKVFAKGKADSEALNQMIDAGIPIVEMLGEEFGVSGAQIYEMASKGEISAAAIQRAFQKMSGKGGVYAGMMEKMSGTITGLWGGIIGQLEYAGALIGESLEPITKSILNYFKGWADTLVTMCSDGRMIQYFSTVALTGVEMGAQIAKAFLTVKEYGVATFKAICDVGMSIWHGMQGSAIVAFVTIIKGFNTLVEYIPAAFANIGTLLSAAWDGYRWAAASTFAFILNTVYDTVNGVITLLNQIPGVKLDLAEKPAFISKIEKFAKEAGESAKQKLKDVADSKEFKEAEKRTAKRNEKWQSTEENGNSLVNKSANELLNAAGRFTAAGDNIAKGGKTIDGMANQAGKKILDWQKSAQETLAERQKAGKKEDKDKGDPDDLNPKNLNPEKVKTDSLTKIGLYGNFGGNAVKSIDKERNKLLEAIRDGVEALKPSTEGTLA